jgi:uncharacterized membrane protein SpoIIM required for sporulation/ABC-type transport system involved in multi-copper enzyme maturation permease subunit
MKMRRSVLSSFQPAWIVTRREIKDQIRDWRIAGPMLLLAVLFPLVMEFTAGQLISLAGRYGVTLQKDQLIPFLLMIVGFFPVTISLVIALESFVGEKERHSIEALLSSPLSDKHLYLGKLMAAIIPPLLVSFLGMAIYLVAIYRQGGWLPDRITLVQILALTTLNGLIMVCGAVVISTQTTSMKGANLLAAFVIIPMALLLQGQSMVLVWSNKMILWWTILGEAVIALLLIRMGIAHFNREDLLGREFDLLDLRWIWRTYWEAFLGQARSPIDWIRTELKETFRRLALPTFVMAGVILVSILVGALLSSRYALPIEAFNRGALEQGTIQGLDSVRFFESDTVSVVWFHNVRTILLATLMGSFSFGSLAVVILLIPFILIGFFTAMMSGVGLSPWMFFTAFVLPHGVLEIPAIILAGAAILHLGASLAAPAQGRGIGAAWLEAFADWTRVMLGLVIPLLLGAAFLEVLVTPAIARLIFGQ